MQSHKRPHELSDTLLKNFVEMRLSVLLSKSESARSLEEPVVQQGRLSYRGDFCCQAIIFSGEKKTLSNPLTSLTTLVSGDAFYCTDRLCQQLLSQ